MEFQLAPSLLACDFARLGEEAQAVEQAGADVLHLDVMDGHFVPNLTLGPPIAKKLRPTTKLPIDAHLMVENPDSYLEDFQKAGCDWLSVHVEACPHLHRTLARIRDLGMKPGVAINPGTSLAALDAVIEDADYFLLMSVNPGFGGQAFIENTVDRIRELRKTLDEKNPKALIEVDGGIKKDNALKVLEAGARVLVVGTGLFEASDYKERVEEFRKIAG